MADSQRGFQCFTFVSLSTVVPPSTVPSFPACLLRHAPAGVLAQVFLFQMVAVTFAQTTREISPAAVMPGFTEHTLIGWRDGAPYWTGARYSDERGVLRVETGFISAEFDTARVQLIGFRGHAAGRSESEATEALLGAALLPTASLECSVSVGGAVFTLRGRLPLALDRNGHPADPLEFPVRIIESGRFLQHFEVHGLELRDERGTRLPAVSWMEVRIWPDRCGLTLVVRPERRLAAAAAWMRTLTLAGRHASLREEPGDWESGRAHRVTLDIDPSGDAVPAEREPVPLERQSVPMERQPVPGLRLAVRDSPGVRAAVHWDPVERSHVVDWSQSEWSASQEGNYPESMLDAFPVLPVEIANESGVPRILRVRFSESPVHAPTGFVPMFLDESGMPAGLPFQVGKNWHRDRPGREPLPHSGVWVRARTTLEVPPRSRLSLHYATAYARWGGVPSASLAQLSLVGWGHNGFWEQFALGSYGETFCLQPGRVMRRALFTDFRPLHQLGYARDERWAWTSNLGGGDTLVRVDPAGRHIPSRRNATRHVSPGPNLARLDHSEVSVDGAMRSGVSVLVSRTDDLARVHLRIRHEVVRRVEHSALALFQLGADGYNDTDSPAIAWGDAAGIRAEFSSARKEPLPPAWEARGSSPWLSLHGQVRDDRARSGQGTRGLIVREWSARLGGGAVDHPWFAAKRGSAGRLAAELRPPPGVLTLEAGDFVEMLLEWVALPISAERYYGKDEGFKSALAEGANTWRPVWREASGNRPWLETAAAGRETRFPLTVQTDADGRAAFRLGGGLGWIPLRVGGLTRPGFPLLERRGRAGVEPVLQGPRGRAFWQMEFDGGTRTWTATFNLPANDGATDYVFTQGGEVAAGVR